jgi:cysteine-rich repeat protein
MSREECGNGIVDTVVAEVCDDGENVYGNTCNDSCEELWSGQSLSAPSLYFGFDDAQFFDATYQNLGAGPLAPGTLSGTEPGLAGVVAEALGFDGQASTLLSAAGLPERPEASLTVSVWVLQKGPSAATSSDIVTYTDIASGRLGFALRTSGTNEVSFEVGEAATGLSARVTSNAFTWNEWTHVVGRYDLATASLEITVNGELAGSAAPEGVALSFGNPEFRVGRGFNGVIDELAVWPERLSNGEVLALHAIGLDRRSVGAQSEANALVSPCARYLRENPGAADGVYNLPIGGPTLLLPVLCDMTAGGWTLLFKKSSGISRLADEIWLDAPLNESASALLTRGFSADDYASRLVHVIGEYDQARVEIIASSAAVKSLLFNTSGASALGWFSPERYVSGGWTDVPSSADWRVSAVGRFFDLSAWNTPRRAFTITDTYTSCAGAQGWLLLTGNLGGTTCSFDSPTHAVQYATGTGKSSLTSFATADSLMIFAR